MSVFSGKRKYSSVSFMAFAECAASACLAAPAKNGDAFPGSLKKMLENRDAGKAWLKETGSSLPPPAR